MIIDKVDSCDPLYIQVYRHTCSVDRMTWPFIYKHSVCTTCWTDKPRTNTLPSDYFDFCVRKIYFIWEI